MRERAVADGEIRVNVAEFAVARERGLLTASGLGSCVAIVLYDASTRIGAVAHVLLPSAELSRDRSRPAKFPASAVPLLVAEMRALGSWRRPTARLVGGASMFGTLLAAGGVNIGERNVAASRSALAEAGILVTGEDVGGDYGRTIVFDVSDGSLRVRSLGQGERVL
jgi:chemotaxis protein CheD